MTWPTRRGDETTIREQHPHHADHLRRMLDTGDPLADDVVTELHRHGKPARRQLLDGLTNGLHTLTDPPPAITALLTETETAATRADHDQLDHGSAAYLSVPLPQHIIALSQGSLVNTYSAPSIAAVLLRTGRLVTMAERRLNETGKWSTQTMLPGGLRPGAGGYTATIMVRILHANVRAATLADNWDTAAWGTPINQVDQARTWLDLNYVPYRALTAMGHDFTDTELASVYARWRLIARLLGVDPGFHHDIESHDDAHDLATRIETTVTAPDDGCRRLVASLNHAATTMMSTMLGTPEPTTDALMRAYIWHIHGPDRATALDVAPSDLHNLLPVLIANTRETRALRRQLPHAWRQHQRTNQATVENMHRQPGQAVYETVTTHGE